MPGTCSAVRMATPSDAGPHGPVLHSRHQRWWRAPSEPFTALACEAGIRWQESERLNAAKMWAVATLTLETLPFTTPMSDPWSAAARCPQDVWRGEGPEKPRLHLEEGAGGNVFIKASTTQCPWTRDWAWMPKKCTCTILKGFELCWQGRGGGGRRLFASNRYGFQRACDSPCTFIMPCNSAKSHQASKTSGFMENDGLTVH